MTNTTNMETTNSELVNQLIQLREAADEMLKVLIDLRDGDYELYGEAFNQIDRAINNAQSKLETK